MAMAMEFKRGPASTGYLHGSGSAPEVFYNSSTKDIRFCSTIPSKGGGDTRCMLRIDSEEFGWLIRTMLKADGEKFYDLARAMVTAGHFKAIEAFDRVKQEEMDRAKRFLERHRAGMAGATLGAA